MRRLFWIIPLCCFVAATGSLSAADGRVLKVLPQLLDLQGRHSLSPSLYERDAYQAYLRQHTNEISGMRFAVRWKASGEDWGPLKLSVELRGVARGALPTTTVLEQQVKPGGWFSHWTSLPVTGEEYRNLGVVTAWRVRLWDGDTLLGEQQSFLW